MLIVNPGNFLIESYSITKGSDGAFHSTEFFFLGNVQILDEA